MTERIDEIRKEIKPFLADPTWEVFAADEVRIELEALTRRAWLKQGERKEGLLEQVHLIPMPPYAPDHNPIEHVWNDAKGAQANHQFDTFAETKAAFETHIAGRIFNYRI